MRRRISTDIEVELGLARFFRREKDGLRTSGRNRHSRGRDPETWSFHFEPLLVDGYHPSAMVEEEKANPRWTCQIGISSDSVATVNAEADLTFGVRQSPFRAAATRSPRDRQETRSADQDATANGPCDARYPSGRPGEGEGPSGQHAARPVVNARHRPGGSCRLLNEPVRPASTQG